MSKTRNKRAFKKVLSGALAFSLCFGSILPGNFPSVGRVASAEEAVAAVPSGGTETINGLTYTYIYQGGGFVITDVSVADSDVVEENGGIADLIALNDTLEEQKGASVIAIQGPEDGFDSIFRYKDIKTIKLPNTLTSIPKRAFAEISTLTTVEFEETDTNEQSQLTSIGQYAFDECRNLVYVTIPSSVETIGAYAFYNCLNLTNVNFNAVKEDGEISPLTMADPEGTTSLISIGQDAFEFDGSIETIVLPGTLTSLGKNSFGNVAGSYEGKKGLSKVLFLNKKIAYNTLSSAGFTSGADSNNTHAFYTIYTKGENILDNNVYSFARRNSDLGFVHRYLVYDYYDFNADTIQATLVRSSSAYYTGKEVTGSAISISLSRTVDNVKLKEGTDYTVSYEENINAGTAKLNVTPVEGSIYHGETFTARTYTINKRDLADDMVLATIHGVDLATLSGLSDEQKKEKVKSLMAVALDNGTKIPKGEYDIKELTCEEAGENKGSVTIAASTGAINVTGEKTFTFDIQEDSTAKHDISIAEVIVSDTEFFKNKKNKVEVKYEGETLVEDEDYLLEYFNDTTPGTASVKITGIGEYTGEVTGEYTITKRNIENKTIEKVLKDESFNTEGIAVIIPGENSTVTPKITLTDTEDLDEQEKGNVLVEDRDYSVSYEKNTAPGTASAIITAMGNYTGKVTKDYLIKYDISSAKITVSDVRYTALKEYFTPEVTVTMDGMEEALTTDDYEVSYRSNDGVGTATVIITGKGDFTGKAETTFKILASDTTSGSIEIEGITYGYQYANGNNGFILSSVSGYGTTADIIALSDTLVEQKGYPIVGLQGPEDGFNSIFKEGAPAMTTLKLPNTLTRIPKRMFSEHPTLANVEFEETDSNEPSKLTSIGESAFDHCENLVDVTIPSSVETIGKDAFYWCLSLADVKFNAVKDDGTISPLSMSDPEGTTSLTSIGMHAFEFDYCIHSIVLPASLTSVGLQAFNQIAGSASTSKGLSEMLVLNKQLDLSEADLAGSVFSDSNTHRLYTIYEKNEDDGTNKIKSFAKQTKYADAGFKHEYLCQSLDITKEPEGTYYYSDEGIEFDAKGMEVTPVYYTAATSAGIKAEASIPVKPYMVSGYDAGRIGKQTLIISYGGANAFYDIRNYFKFDQKSVTSDFFDEGDICYTGKAITFDGIVVSLTADDTAILEEGTDYTLEYEDNINAGTATIKIAPAAGSDFEGEAFTLGTFEIQKRDLADAAVEASVGAIKADELSGLSEEQKKEKVKSLISVVLNNEIKVPVDAYEILELSCETSGKDAGSVTIFADDSVANYTGEKTITFDIEGTGTPEPVITPTEAAIATPTAESTEEPMVGPTAVPTEEPMVGPTAVPTEEPMVGPTVMPTETSTEGPAVVPTEASTKAPTTVSTGTATEVPTIVPTEAPTEASTIAPTDAPTIAPTEAATEAPMVAPTEVPVVVPTGAPVLNPTQDPTATVAPTATPKASSKAGTKTTTKKLAKAKITKVKVTGKNVKVTWKKVANAKGYKVQIASKRTFKKNLKTVSLNKLTYTFKKMKKGYWYVRVVAYQTVNGKEKLGTYSTVRKIKVKR